MSKRSKHNKGGNLGFETHIPKFLQNYSHLLAKTKKPTAEEEAEVEAWTDYQKRVQDQRDDATVELIEEEKVAAMSERERAAQKLEDKGKPAFRKPKENVKKRKVATKSAVDPPKPAKKKRRAANKSVLSFGDDM